MKKITLILVVIAALTALAPKAMAQTVLGGMVSWDQERVEQAKGVDFSLTAYDLATATEADLIGFHDAVNGLYPVVPQGTWLMPVVDPTGFGKLEGVDYDPVGNLQPNSREWVPCDPYRFGGYSTLIDTRNKLGPISFRFRIRHRDGRDRLNFVIFTATWIRGGNLMSRFRVTIQKEPEELRNLRGEARLPYLRGFIPATARTEEQRGNTQQYIVPPQTATAQANPMQQGVTNGEFPTLNPPQGGQNTMAFAPFGVEVWARQLSQSLTEQDLSSLTGLIKIAEPENKSSAHTETSLTVNQTKVSTVVRFTSNRPFTVRIRYNGGEQDAKVEKTTTGYVCTVYGGTSNFLSKGIELVVATGDQTRTIKFKEN